MQTIISKSLSNQNQSIDSTQLPEATQNRFSMALFSEPGRQARDLLSNNFDVRLVSLHTPINHFDCCLIDCRGQQLAEPVLTSIDNFAGVKFVLVDESTVISNAAQAITGQYQLITENEFDSPTLMVRVSANALSHPAFDASSTAAESGATGKSSASEQERESRENSATIKNFKANISTTKQAIFSPRKTESTLSEISKNKLAAASHDIRQPLQAMSLFIHSLESKLSNEQQHSILGKLKQSAISLNNSLDDMLGLVKPDTQTNKHSVEVANQTSKLDQFDSIDKPLQDYTVMVLDNNQEVVSALEISLKDAGLHVYPATSLNEACEIINEIDQLPDMLLVDFNLDDDCQGDDAIKTICNTAKKVIPSIVITSETCASKLHRAQEIANTVLSKPVQAEHLLATINHFIDDPATC